jgi:hypothetical protein
LADLELRGIAERLMAEVAPDPVWPLCEPMHVADDGSLELVAAAGGRLAGDGVLQVGVQALVWVELGFAPFEWTG